MEPSLHVLNQPINGNDVLMTIVNSYVSLLAICSIQFWLGLISKNFIVPIAIGIALWFTGSILVMELDLGFATYFPYSFHVYGSFQSINPNSTRLDGLPLDMLSCFFSLAF